MPGRAGPLVADIQEPVWFVRIVLLLFFAAAAGFLAREVFDVVQALRQ